MHTAHDAKRAPPSHSGLKRHAAHSALLCLLAAAPSCSAFSAAPSILPSAAARAGFSPPISASRRHGTFASVRMLSEGSPPSTSDAASAVINAYSGEDEANVVSQLGFDMVMVRSSLKLEQRIRCAARMPLHPACQRFARLRPLSQGGTLGATRSVSDRHLFAPGTSPRCPLRSLPPSA